MAVAFIGAAVFGASTYIAGATIVAALWAFAGAFALGALAQALAPKPGVGSINRGYQVNTLGSALDHQIIYGRTRVGGVIVFDTTTGAPNQDNEYLHRVIVMSGHEITEFESLWIDDELIVLDANNFVISPARYAGEAIRINTHLGEDLQTADTDLVSEVGDWTVDHRLCGLAYIYVRLDFDPEVFLNGVPTFTAIVKGKKVYNALSEVTEWSENPAYCIMDYLEASYGLGEERVNIDIPSVKQAGFICDQTNLTTDPTKTLKRYTCNGAFTTSVTPDNILSELLKCMGGSLWYAQGAWLMKPAYWTTPLITLDESDLRSNIGLNTKHSRRDNFNGIRGTWRGEDSYWQVTDYPQVSQSVFVDNDNGQESFANIDYIFTSNWKEAKRLSLISLERNREQLTLSAKFGLKAFQLQVGDNIYLANERFGWEYNVDPQQDTRKEFEVIEWKFGLQEDLDLQVEMVLRETNEVIFDEEANGNDFNGNDSELEPPNYVPVLEISAFPSNELVGNLLINVITLTVATDQPGRINKVETQYKNSISDLWINLGEGPLGNYQARNIASGSYDFRARGYNSIGSKGVWTYLYGIQVSTSVGPPANVTNFSAEGNGEITVLSWDPVPDFDLDYYRIRYSPLDWFTNPTKVSWANSITDVDKVPSPATSVSVPARSGSYMIKAVDTSGLSSLQAAFVYVPQSDIDTFSTGIYVEYDPAFLGSKTNVEISATDQLQLIKYNTVENVGTYFLEEVIDTSSNDKCRVRLDIQNLRGTGGTELFDSRSGLFNDAPGFFDDTQTLYEDLADTNVVAFVSSTRRDPTNPNLLPSDWTPYTTLRVRDINARGFRFKVELRSTTVDITPTVPRLAASIEYNQSNSILWSGDDGDDSTLSDLYITGGYLAPSFSPYTNTYRSTLTNDTTQTRVVPTSLNELAVITVDNVVVTSGTESDPIDLEPGVEKTITLKVVYDGTTETYEILATRSLEADARLDNIVLSVGTLDPPFNLDIDNYTARVASSVTSLTVTPTVHTTGTTITVNGAPVLDTKASNPIDLLEGVNIITVLGTALDRSSTEQYILQVTRADAAVSTLSAINISSSEAGFENDGLNPAASYPQDTQNFTSNGASGVTQLKISLVPQDPNATMTFNGALAESGVEYTVTYAPGTPAGNTFPFTCTAEDGITKSNFNISMTGTA